MPVRLINECEICVVLIDLFDAEAYAEKNCGSWLACEWLDAVQLKHRVSFFAGKPAPTLDLRQHSALQLLSNLQLARFGVDVANLLVFER
jgi:hypothetical protein